MLQIQNVKTNNLTTIGFDYQINALKRPELVTFSLLDLEHCKLNNPEKRVGNFTGQLIQTAEYRSMMFVNVGLSSIEILSVFVGEETFIQSKMDRKNIY